MKTPSTTTIVLAALGATWTLFQMFFGGWKDSIDARLTAVEAQGPTLADQRNDDMTHLHDFEKQTAEGIATLKQQVLDMSKQQDSDSAKLTKIVELVSRLVRN